MKSSTKCIIELTFTALVIIAIAIIVNLAFKPREIKIKPISHIVQESRSTGHLNAKETGLIATAYAKDIVEIPDTPQISTSSESFSYDLVDALKVKNPKTLKALIKCESKGENVSRPDSDGIISRGILQYHDGSLGLTNSTWADFSHLSGIKGSPEVPSDAIKMTDWAISHGFLGRWSCARILGLVK